MTTIPWLADDIAARLPWVTVDQMREVDRAMVEDYEIVLLQMMERAGNHLAHLARERFLQDSIRGKSVVVLAGAGGNGGGALVCARTLAARGADVRVLIADDHTQFTEETEHQLRILAHMGIEAHCTGHVQQQTANLIVDGLVGYGLRDAPRGRTAELIRWANESAAPVLALDVPSGLDGTSGVGMEPVIRALATITLALPKAGLRAGLASGLVGELYLADIGVPPRLYGGPRLQLVVPDVFEHADIVRLQ